MLYSLWCSESVWGGAGCISKYLYVSGLRLLYRTGHKLNTQLQDQLLAITQRGFTFNSLFSYFLIF